MAFADSGTHCLGWLLASTVFDGDILIWSRPCLPLETTRFKDTLIGEDQMPIVLEDLVDLVSQIDGHLGVLPIKFILLLRLILDLDLLVLVAIEFQNPTQMLGLNDTVGELAMEQLSSLG